MYIRARTQKWELNLLKTKRICVIQSDTKKRELFKNPTKMEEIQEKKFIDRN